MMKQNINQYIVLVISILMFSSCGKDWVELEPKGTELESSFYKTEEEVFQGLVATYDVLQWGGTDGWTMQVGLLNTASDDCHAGGSDASDQPNWVAWNNFTLDPFLGPQLGLWNKNFAGIYRANLVMEKAEELEGASPEFVSRTVGEAKFLRAYFYFDLVRFFANVPLITRTLGGDDFYNQVQASPQEIYAQIESDLNAARNTFEIPSSLPSVELGRVTQGAITALLGKVILFQNNSGRMQEAADLFDEVINSGMYALENDFGDIFRPDNEFGIESVFEINYSGNQRGGWGNFANGTEGNYDVQFFGMRDYVGPDFANGWSFCPVSESLVDLMKNDPRFEHTIIDGALLKAQGASYTEGYQNTDYFIRKYAGLQEDRALDGEPALNWDYNVRVIRLADVFLMAAEANAILGDSGQSVAYLNKVRQRVFLQPVFGLSGDALLNAIYRERQIELATEGHRYFDLIRTGRAAEVLGPLGFTSGKNELLPIPQKEIDILQGDFIQNPGY